MPLPRSRKTLPFCVPGGIVRHKESMADRVRACAIEELGAAVSCDPAPVFVLEHLGEQQTRGHHVSLLFRCRLLGALDASRVAAPHAPAVGQWCWFDRCPPDLLPAQAAYAQFF